MIVKKTLFFMGALAGSHGLYSQCGLRYVGLRFTNNLSSYPTEFWRAFLFGFICLPPQSLYERVQTIQGLVTLAYLASGQVMFGRDINKSSNVLYPIPSFSFCCTTRKR